MRINFDMDGTIANLYGVNNWLNMLHNEDPTPYAQATPLINMNTLARYLNRLIAQGHEIAIISWLAKNSTAEYDEKVAKAKREWLRKHLKSVKFTEIAIVPYGTPKEELGTGILFDDEENNRKNWKGKAFTEKEIFSTLKAILE